MATQLAEVERLARELTPADQARLLQALASRVAAVVANPAAIDPATAAAQHDAAVARLQAVMDRVAAGATPGESMTQGVSDMRR